MNTPSINDKQPSPIAHPTGPCIQDIVAADLTERRDIGVRKYGVALQPFNGRNALIDLYQELLDAVCYIRQVIEEQSSKEPTL